ncbi:hypothetical protein CYMTET_53446, partial [Cymbomonas tetramitiformis]
MKSFCESRSFDSESPFEVILRSTFPEYQRNAAQLPAQVVAAVKSIQAERGATPELRLQEDKQINKKRPIQPTAAGASPKTPSSQTQAAPAPEEEEHVESEEDSESGSQDTDSEEEDEDSDDSGSMDSDEEAALCPRPTTNLMNAALLKNYQRGGSQSTSTPNATPSSSELPGGAIVGDTELKTPFASIEKVAAMAKLRLREEKEAKLAGKGNASPSGVPGWSPLTMRAEASAGGNANDEAAKGEPAGRSHEQHTEPEAAAPEPSAGRKGKDDGKNAAFTAQRHSSKKGKKAAALRTGLKRKRGDDSGSGGGPRGGRDAEDSEGRGVKATVPKGMRFADLGGIEPILQAIEEIVMFPLTHPEVYSWMGVEPPRGVLLNGPPGCGKTTLAHAIAAEAGVAYFSISAPEVVSGMSGESEAKLRSLFSAAAKAAPALIFIDEIDAITPKRENAQREMERRIVAQLLTCMDDLNGSATSKESEGEEGEGSENAQRRGHVVVIGATNRPDSIDPALRRAGRFDREITLGVPDEAARARILKVLTVKLRLDGDLDLLKIGLPLPGPGSRAPGMRIKRRAKRSGRERCTFTAQLACASRG